MILSLPNDIQKNLIERCPQLNFVCKSLRLQNFTKPEDLCYPTKEHVLTMKLYKEVLKLEFREGICQVL